MSFTDMIKQGKTRPSARAGQSHVIEQSMYQLTEQVHQELNEAKFSEKNLEKVSKLFARILGKTMGGEFKLLGIESFNRKWGPGQGLRCMNDKGNMLRFNWDLKVGRNSSADLTSIDYWNPNNSNFSKPR